MSHSHSHSGGCDHDHSSHARAPVEDHSALFQAAAPSTLLSSATAEVLRRVHESIAEESLPALFARAEALFHHIVDGAALEECKDHDQLAHTADALAAFVRCSSMVRTEGIFSRNESMGDMKTEDLQYLLIEFFIAELRQRAQPEVR